MYWMGESLGKLTKGEATGETWGENLPRSESGVTGVTGKEGPDRRAFPRQN